MFIGESDGSPNFLIFQPIYKTFTMPTDIMQSVVDKESKGLPNEKVKPSLTANSNLSPKLRWMNYSILRVEFKGNCLKQRWSNFNSYI